jgi:hypothetical protein
MAYFEVMLSGKGITLPFMGTTDTAIGFYVSRIVRAATPVEAEAVAKDLVAAEWRSKRFSLTVVRNHPWSLSRCRPSVLYAVFFAANRAIRSTAMRALPNYSFELTATYQRCYISQPRCA